MEGGRNDRATTTSPLDYPSFKPNVTITGIAANPDADPEPVLVVDGPLAYMVEVKLPCAIRTASIGVRRINDNKGIYIRGIVDVNDVIDDDSPVVRRPGMMRLYSVGCFTFTFDLPQKVEMPILRGRGPERTIKFLVFKMINQHPHHHHRHHDEPATDDQAS